MLVLDARRPGRGQEKRKKGKENASGVADLHPGGRRACTACMRPTHVPPTTNLLPVGQPFRSHGLRASMHNAGLHHVLPENACCSPADQCSTDQWVRVGTYASDLTDLWALTATCR